MVQPRSKRWLIPDVAFVASAATLLYSLFLFPGYRTFFRDSDAGWHIRAGERMVALRALPHSDPFSFTMVGRPWFAWEWGADVLVGIIHEKVGLTGVAFFYGCVIAAGVWLWFRLNWLVGGNFLFACALAAPMLSTANLHWLARPHVISWLFLMGSLLFAQRLVADPRLTTQRVVWVAVLSCLWANIHASFFFGALIALVYATGLFASSFIWMPILTPLSTTALKSSWPTFVSVGSISLIATFVNPYGWQVHRHVYLYLTNNQLLDRIGEFQTFNFHAAGTFQILVALGISVLGGTLAITQRNLPVFFLSAILIAAALRSARGLPLVALLLLPLANGIITKALEGWTGLRMPVRRALDRFLAYSQRLRALDSQASGLVWAPVLALLCFAALRSPAIAANTGFPRDQFPVAAALPVGSLPLDARILAPDKYGGYLIYRFAGQRKVFFDGRSDLYGEEFLKQYGRLVQVRPGWQKIMEPYRFTHALLPNDYSLIPALEQAGWKLVYFDSVCTLLSRK